MLSRAQCRRISGLKFNFAIVYVLGMPQHGAVLIQRERVSPLFSCSRMGRWRPVPLVFFIMLTDHGGVSLCSTGSF